MGGLGERREFCAVLGEALGETEIGVISTAKSGTPGYIIFVKSWKYLVLKFHCAYCILSN